MVRAKDQMTSVPRLNSGCPEVFDLPLQAQKSDFFPPTKQERSCSSQGQMHMDYIFKRVMLYQPEQQYVTFQFMNLLLELDHTLALLTPGAGQIPQLEQVQNMWLILLVWLLRFLHFRLTTLFLVDTSFMITLSMKVQVISCSGLGATLFPRSNRCY